MIPRIEFTDDGPVAPTREAITAGLWQMMNEAFASSQVPLSQDARTPQGQLVTSLTALIDDQNSAMIELANNFDPRYAFGAFQEALGAVYFLTRGQATPSIAQLEFTGLPGTAIPKDFVIVDDSGREWKTTTASVVGAGLVEAICTTPGPIQAAPGTINTFKETIDGLDRVENPSAAAVGANEETRAQFEDRRYESVAANSKMTNGAVRGAVGNLPGVIDVMVVDNPTDNSIVVGSTDYPMIRNSLLASVVGGDEQLIAEQILIKGGTGCSFVGNTEVTYLDKFSGNVRPPQYTVKFLRPAHVNTYLKLTVINPELVSYASIQDVKSKILEEFHSGENRARIGGMVIGANYLCAIESENIRPVKMEVSTNGSTWSDLIEFGVDQFPVTSSENISVVGL